MENESDEFEVDPHINRISGTIIDASYAASNALGAGLLEKVYENAMVVELEHLGLKVVPQYPVPIFYRGVQVGDYYVDLLVEDSV